jgi:hypothetical protein
MWPDLTGDDPNSAGNDRIALSESLKESVREQLNRLLASPYFIQSKRSVTFLRFITDQTLAGDAENIKERILGIEIFGRDANYDTASDPVVRVTASEIRKRVAQYYQEPGHQDELLITLPSGSYVPRFHWPKGAPGPGLQSAAAHAEGRPSDRPMRGAVDLAGAQPDQPLIPVQGFALTSSEPSVHIQAHPEAGVLRGSRLFNVARALIGLAAVLLLAGLAYLWQGIHRSAFDFFWQPVLTTNDPVLLCIADQLQDSGFALRDPTEPARQVWMNDDLKKNSYTTVAIDDLNAIIKVAAILQSRGKQYTIKGQGTTTLTDLRAGPAIFVGAFDNAWTLRVTNALRNHFTSDAAMTHFSVADSMTPTPSHWVVDRSSQMATGTYHDYAIVARFTDSNTDKYAVVVAGIGRCATLAAGEFLTNTNDLARLELAAKSAGDKKNIEVVLSTEVIDGQPGSPKTEAVYFW